MSVKRKGMFNYVKIVTVGNLGIGKSCILVTYTTGKFPEEYVPTIFDNYSTTMMSEKKVVHLLLVDVTGSEKYDKLRHLSYPQTDVFFLTFAVNSPGSFEDVKNFWVHEVKHHVPNAIRILVGTKSDLRECVSSDKSRLRCVSKEQAQQAAKEMGAACYMECSALTQDGLQNLFNEAVHLTIEKRNQTAKNHKQSCCLIQ